MLANIVHENKFELCEDSEIDSALRKFFSNRTDLFDGKSEFLGFSYEKKHPKARGFFSKTICGRIAYRKEGVVCFSEPLAVKHTRGNGKLLEFYEMSAISNESQFYSTILPFFAKFHNIGRIFPKFYSTYQECDSANGFQSITIMEDLKAGGYQYSVCGYYLNYEHLVIMIKKLGEFHACSYLVKKKDPLRFNCLVKKLANNQISYGILFFKIADDLLEPFVNVLQNNPQYASQICDVNLFLKRTKQSLFDSLEDDKDDQTLVLCHGDYAAHNFLFKYRNGCPVEGKIFDFGNCKFSTPAFDLVWYLFANANREMKKKHWDDLIDIYYEALSSTFPDVQVPSKEAITWGIRKKLPLNLFGGIFFIPFVEAMCRGFVKMDKVGSCEDMLKAGKLVDINVGLDILKDFLDLQRICEAKLSFRLSANL